MQLIVRRHRGDRRRAAEELPISLATLKRKLIEARRPDTYRGRPLSTAFVARGLPQTSIRDLDANLQRIVAAIRDHAAGIGTRIAARAAIDAAIAGGLTAIQHLDSKLHTHEDQ
ncbi:MAG: hypothetical protein HY048_02480 [Acidobacteria bacterium]|nr:hypothetical protein [Acidobacteriota bacterium]